MYKKIKIYVSLVSALIFVSTLLYILSYFFYFDKHIGYLKASILTSISVTLSILAVIGIMSIFKIIPKNKIPNDPIEYSKRTRIIALYVALVLVAFNIYRFLTTNAPYLSPQVTSISTLIGAISSSYFFLIFFNSSTHTSNIKVICGVFPILSSTLTITENHLNPFITMNSPIKISLMLAMMSIMIFMLYEMRSLSYKHHPRSFIISSFIAALLLSMFSVAYIVSYSANILPHAEKSLLSISIISLSFLIYILSRIFDALKQYKSIN